MNNRAENLNTLTTTPPIPGQYKIHIPFNKPYTGTKELLYIKEAIQNNKLAGDGRFTKKCHAFFEEKYGFHEALLTTSCTAALEMSALLMDLKEGDEVIMPSYTFVSTANAFALRGAKIVFADSEVSNPNINARQLESLITPNTKAIVLVHYAGAACDMDKIMALSKKYNLFVVEDAAQAIDAYYKNKPLGSFGHFATFSFHETKNIIAGEGGMLVINEKGYAKRAEIIREKGTNRSAFFRGEVDKYSWVDIGSSYLPSEMIAAFLYAQLENMDTIQQKRLSLWQLYYDALKPLERAGHIRLPFIPNNAKHNAHVFYLICRSLEERTALIHHLKSKGVHAVFHYLSLHKSDYYQKKHDGRELLMSDHYTDCLVRLPLFYELKPEKVDYVVECVKSFYKGV